MTVLQFDPDNWILSTHRSLQSYVEDALGVTGADGDVAVVEMSFPDTTKITKETPLDKVLIHFEQDDMANPQLGFGTPGVEEFDEDAATVVLKEATRHLINFDVGVWVSAQCGGTTGRMQYMQTLANLFASPVNKRAMREQTDGLYPMSFSGGRNVLDRINDILVWRATEMTLVVEVFGRVIPASSVPAIVDGFTLDDSHTTIKGGSPVTDEPVTTP